MELSELGLDAWFEKHAKKACNPNHKLARVMAADRGRYDIKNEDGYETAKAAGKLRHHGKSKDELPIVGDWVCVEYKDSRGSSRIHSVLPRKSTLRRKSIGKSGRYQMIAANIDVAFIVQSCSYDFNVRRLERYLVMVNEGGIEPVLILTKTDLIAPDDLDLLINEIRKTGIEIRILAISNVSKQGLDKVKEFIVPGKTYCLLGSSGVGKTTLINQLSGEALLETADVHETGEGKHTTVRRELIILKDGAILIDMPGMRELGIMKAGEGIEESFADIHKLSLSCKFNDCSHIEEPGCAVTQALKNQELDLEHYLNYCKIKAESKFNDKTYAEKRKMVDDG